MPSNSESGYGVGPSPITENASFEHNSEQLANQSAVLLHRVAQICKEAFLQWRELLFEWIIYRIEEKDDTVELYIDNYEQGEKQICYVPFWRVDLVRRGEHKELILTTLACDQSIIWMKELMEFLLKERFKEIKVLHLGMPEGSISRVTRVWDPLPDAEVMHSVVKIVPLHGEDYIIDACHIQYKVAEPATPLRSYYSKTDCTPLKENDHEEYGEVETSEVDPAEFGQQGRISRTLVQDSIAEVYKLASPTIAALENLDTASDESYIEAKTTLLAAMHARMTWALQQYHGPTKPLLKKDGYSVINPQYDSSKVGPLLEQ